MCCVRGGGGGKGGKGGVGERVRSVVVELVKPLLTPLTEDCPSAVLKGHLALLRVLFRVHHLMVVQQDDLVRSEPISGPVSLVVPDFNYSAEPEPRVGE